MYMKDIEIVGSFKRAENPKEQVRILAQLNACDKEEIIEVLKRNGIDTSKVEEQLKPKKRPYRSKKKEATKVAAKKINEVEVPVVEEVVDEPVIEEQKAEKQIVPKVIIAIVQDRISMLTELIKETEKERDTLCDYLQGVTSNG